MKLPADVAKFGTLSEFEWKFAELLVRDCAQAYIDWCATNGNIEFGDFLFIRYGLDK